MKNLKPMWGLYVCIGIVLLLYLLVSFNAISFIAWSIMLIAFLCTDDKKKYTKEYIATRHIKEQRNLKKKHD
jgi:hypothetical protein